MKIFLCIVVLTSTLGLACNSEKKPVNAENTNTVQGSVQGPGAVKTVTRDLAGFTKIKAENAVTVNVTITKDFGVAVEAAESLHGSVLTEVVDDTLVISLKDNPGKKSNITINVLMPALTGLDVAGAATAQAAGISSDEMDITAVGASKVYIGGTTKNLKVKAEGASSVSAENLKAETAEVNSAGASTILVAANKSLTAEATGASTVIYSGAPKSLKQTAKDVSTIKKQ